MYEQTYSFNSSGGNRGGSLRILLVDDNIIFRTSALRYLNSCLKYELLTWASSGEEALKRVEQFNPTLILLDVSLPGMNGLQTAKTIRSMNKKAKIMILTIGNDVEYIKEAKAVGADEFISKSDFGIDIERKIKNVFRKSL